tara:strand:+ start:306 stop:818 length:513 start_codon:yes stop_codon:yes gene_type:complete
MRGGPLNEKWRNDYNNHQQQDRTYIADVNKEVPPVDHDEIVISGDDDPLIPEGEYKGSFIGSNVTETQWGAKLSMSFKIEDQGVQLLKYYNVKSSGKTPVRGNPKWEVGNKSSYARDYKRLFGKSRRLSITAFKGKRFLLKVRNVTEDSEGQPLGKANHYSKIKRLMELI